MFFHHRQTQADCIGDLLITSSFADKPRNFLFAPGESDKMRQMGGARRADMRSSSTAQIFAFDKKVRSSYANRTELFQAEDSTQIRPFGMMNHFLSGGR